MIALVRYQLAVLGHSQRYLAPVLLHVGVVGTLHQDNRGAVLPVFAVTAGSLLVVAGWLTIALVDVEDPVQRMVTQAHAGSPCRLTASASVAVLMCSAALGAVPVVWSALAHDPRPTGPELLTGALAHLACAAVGIGLALPCSRLLVNGLGRSLVLSAVLFATVLLARWVPLVFPLLHAMNSELPGPALLGWTGLAASAVLAASVLLTAKAAARRVG
ncbi:hypothetical protein A8924_0274 [Saccharopolyspora erythraea NRRL 2338]|uniref:hypothetical protein n=1 Tax=Saccharopolyspora erythraea TaxID=1836 RepID=UPI0001D310C5|nr:hypothetical protein [Saccharopolyspora erythraea]EQD85761.1 hypothetical protein N599_13360 [Saccharopolyspora erythraea D]PFG93049.1 hypothetical protein A8924_0274 [Saccharopolyspora erythraea NRRL 2338]QRK89926.1 hypothetical protein JQX30_36490 [Saccharopolyspora erythraea]